jgi:oxygen-independent coproporphyrinogen-3 oxidase
VAHNKGVAGVYIAYPFCAQKCTYCNFASGVMPREIEGQYPEALVREIEAAEFAWMPDTVYLGGGTPSSMDLDALEQVLCAIPGRQWREATIEAAPGTITAEKALRWSEAGINRVSLGVQSFVRTELARTGRRHTADTVAADVAVLHAAGLKNLNLDLIAGLPGQTRQSWRDSLDWIERLSPPHVSVYMLEVDEDSRLGSEILLGGARYGAGDVPEDEAIADFYETAVERLNAMGIERYEISNFARPGFESIHNLKYWRREPYLGFGADAHSCDGARRWQNVETVADYIRLSPHARVEETAADAREEKFFVGLRLSEGVDADIADWQRHGLAIQRFVDGGLMERAGSRLRLTPRGVMVSNEVFQEFV